MNMNINQEKLNILMIYPSLDEGGAAKMMITFADILIEKGYNVTIAAKKGNLISYITNNKINFIPLNNKFKNSNFFIQVFIYILVIFQVLIETKKRNINIIFNNSRYTSILCLVVSKLNKIKFYSCAHIVNRGKKIVGNLLWGHKVLAVSNAVKKSLINTYNVKPDKIEVVRNSISPLIKYSDNDLNKFKLKIGLNKSYKVCCLVAGFRKTKGHIILLKAWNKIIKNINNKIHLILQGYGTEEIIIKKFIFNNNLNKYVTILPRDCDVSKVIGISKFFILPSFREGLPVVVLESFSLGKPVIATDIPGTNEIVKNNYNGILVPPENINKLVEAIIKLYKNNNLRDRLGNNALKTYYEEFSFEKYKKNIVNFFVF